MTYVRAAAWSDGLADRCKNLLWDRRGFRVLYQLLVVGTLGYRRPTDVSAGRDTREVTYQSGHGMRRGRPSSLGEDAIEWRSLEEFPRW